MFRSSAADGSSGSASGVIPLDELLTGVVLPAVVSGLLLLALRLIRGWPAALAVGAGIVCGHIGLRGWRGLPPRDATDWILLVAAGATVVGMLLCARGELRPRPPVLRGLLLLVLASAAAYCLLVRVAAGGDAAPDPRLAALGPGAVVAVAWLAAQQAAWPRRAELPLLLLIVAVGAAVALGLSGSQRLAQHAGVVAAALGGASVAALAGWGPERWDGALAVAALALSSLLLAGRLFADLPAACPLLLAAAVPAHLVARRFAGSPPRSMASRGLPLAVAAACAGAAVALAIAASPSFEGL